MYERRNRKAKLNGIDAERAAIRLIANFFDTDKVDFINELIDFYINDSVPVEVKSCQEWIHENRNGQKIRRHGRFTLDKKQHNYLVENDGLYLFIVNLSNGKKLFRFIKAKDLQYKQKITWWKLEKFLEQE